MKKFMTDQEAGKKWAEEQSAIVVPSEIHITDSEVIALREFVQQRWTLGKLHGIKHWDRVFRNGQMLQDEGVNPRVVQRFAYLHDSCRTNDGYDEMHGPKAAVWIEGIRASLLPSLTDEEFHQLKEACMHHTTMQHYGDPTIDACFDADRLDLIRVGITPNPRRMASPKGEKLALYFNPIEYKKEVDVTVD